MDYRIKYIITLILFSFAQSLNAKYNFAFSNTNNFQYITTKLDFPERKIDDNRDKSSISINEYFQTYFYKDEGDLCCEDFANEYETIGTDSLYYGINLSAAYDESSTKRAGIEFQAGLGRPKRAFGQLIIGAAYQEDIVFKKQKGWSEITGFQIGFPDDLHFNYYGVDMLAVIDQDVEPVVPFQSEGSFELALGWKPYIPLFLRIFVNATEIQYVMNKGVNDLVIKYGSSISLVHIQYYCDTFNLSVGYTFFEESLSQIEYDDDENRVSEEKEIKDAIYYGGGIAGDLKNLFGHNKSLFGEFHLLADKNKSFITISKFGVKIMF